MLDSIQAHLDSGATLSEAIAQVQPELDEPFLLHLARHEQWAFIEQLSREKVWWRQNYNVCNALGETILHLFASGELSDRSFGWMHTMLSQGAFPEDFLVAKTCAGYTIKEYLAIQSSERIIEMFLQIPAIRGGAIEKSMQAAIEADNHVYLRCCLELYGDECLRILDDDQNNILQFIAANNSKACCSQLLTKYDAHFLAYLLQQQNANGLTPYDFADETMSSTLHGYRRDGVDSLQLLCAKVLASPVDVSLDTLDKNIVRLEHNEDLEPLLDYACYIIKKRNSENINVEDEKSGLNLSRYSI